ncbi:polysaccharide deacetylase family protein [Candidatus Parcubacteria bacterium]|nr:polysaccharide deacetylase family protein [Candidatus Parcubacteria bacterium]
MNFVIVNYHYIDDEKKYKSGIYPISPQRLRNQLSKLGKMFKFISEEELVLAVTGKRRLPEKSCMITFDDGLKTQYKNALPILEEMKIPAVFYINTLPYMSGKACPVHKIWNLLSIISPAEMLNKVVEYYSEMTGKNIELKKINIKQAKKENKYENDNRTRQLKYLLNSLIKQNIVSKIVDKIFDDYYENELEFCEKTYLSKNNIKKIANNKLFSIGLHTNSHINIPYTIKKEVVEDIVKNYNYIKNVFKIKKLNGISYPIGTIGEADVSEKIKNVVQSLEIKYGFALNREVNYDLNNPLLLKRFDTNDVNGGKYPIIDLSKI